MNRTFYYFVHETADPKSKVIWHGKNRDLCREFCISGNELAQVFKTYSNVLDDEHYIERKYFDTIPEDILKQSNALKVKKRRKNKFDKTVETVERMLDIYGNTIIYRDFEKVEARLNADGYFIKAKYEPERRIRYLEYGNGNGACDIYDECWILELVRKDTITNV